MDSKAARPHTAVIHMMVEVHSLLDTGECSGNIVDMKTLEKYGLKPAVILSVSGFDRHNCLMKLKSKLEKFNEYE